MLLRKVDSCSFFEAGSFLEVRKKSFLSALSNCERRCWISFSWASSKNPPRYAESARTTTGTYVPLLRRRFRISCCALYISSFQAASSFFLSFPSSLSIMSSKKPCLAVTRGCCRGAVRKAWAVSIPTQRRKNLTGAIVPSKQRMEEEAVEVVSGVSLHYLLQGSGLACVPTFKTCRRRRSLSSSWPPPSVPQLSSRCCRALASDHQGAP
mmetsp:Transcript_7060/g.23177  ORF Transcript_7060/g.23177 Transcript_7060/m.23177 type:complete len:210 (+) Transcript_7060:243-872(+)